MLLTSLTISQLTSNLRRQARVASLRERRTGAMYAMTRELGGALMTEQIIENRDAHVGEIFQAKVAILLPDSAEKMRQKVDDPDPQVTLDVTRLDLDIAQWVYDQQKPAGRGTDTLPANNALYLPLKAPMRTRGVLALITDHAAELAIPEQQRMLDTFASQIALALERVHYVEIAQDALINMESERMRNALLSAISHDLRTPLTSIVGFCFGARGKNRMLPWTHRANWFMPFMEEALRMSGLVTNLLDMARLQAGSIRLNRQWSMLEEVVGAALTVCRRTLAGRPVQVRVPADLPLVQVDAVLMERLLANLFENAAKYTPPGSALSVEAAVGKWKRPGDTSGSASTTTDPACRQGYSRPCSTNSPAARRNRPSRGSD